MPLSQLDGGHIVYAVLGPRFRKAVWVFLAVLVGLFLVSHWEGWLVWVGLAVALASAGVCAWAALTRNFWLLVAATVGTSLVGIVLWGSLMGSMLPLLLNNPGRAVISPRIRSPIDAPTPEKSCFIFLANFFVSAWLCLMPVR